ncbi:MAG: hypothetical protein ACRYGF_07975 [Janthinobacterium lividum]
MERFNERFAVAPAKSEDKHRSLSVRGSRLQDILCHREQRHVSEQLAMSYDRKQIILERSPVSEKLSGQYVELYDYPDRPLEVRWKGVSLPYRVFEKDGYKKRPRQVYGPDFIEKLPAPKTVEMTVWGKGGMMKPFHPSPSPWKSLRDFTHSHRTTTMDLY